MGSAGPLAARTRPELPGPPAHRPIAGDCQRAAVHQTNRLPLALLAARSATPLYGALLLREVDGRRDARRGHAAPARTESPAGRSAGTAHGGHCGQPNREERRSDARGGLGRREVTARPETPRAGGYRRLVVGSVGPGGGCLGSRWRAPAAAGVCGPLSRLAAHLGGPALWRGAEHGDRGRVWDRR